MEQEVGGVGGVGKEKGRREGREQKGGGVEGNHRKSQKRVE